VCVCVREREIEIEMYCVKQTVHLKCFLQSMHLGKKVSDSFVEGFNMMLLE